MDDHLRICLGPLDERERTSGTEISILGVSCSSERGICLASIEEGRRRRGGDLAVVSTSCSDSTRPEQRELT